MNLDEKFIEKEEDNDERERGRERERERALGFSVVSLLAREKKFDFPGPCMAH